MNSKSSNKAIKAKMARALSEDMGALSADMKKILIDDLVCAFENRLKVLSKVDSGVTFILASKESEIINASL